jgi:hypothetical protein
MLQRPYTSFVALEPCAKSACPGIIDVDVCVVAPSHDLVAIELKTGDDITLMSAKGDMAGLHICLHPVGPNAMMPSID